MTNIQFIFNVSEKDSLIYKIINHYITRSRDSLVFMEEKKNITKFSEILWSKEISSFLPHLINKSEKMNRICISSNAELMDDVLINATNRRIDCFSRYKNFYELVSLSEDEKVAARERFTFYKDCGYKVAAADSANFHF